MQGQLDFRDGLKVPADMGGEPFELPETDTLAALDFDPEPAGAVDRPKESKPKKTARLKIPEQGPPASKATINRLSAELQIWAAFAVMPMEIKDQVCGPVLAEQVKPTCDAVAKILSRYPDLAAKFIGSSLLPDIAALFLAIKPAAQIIYAHHIAKTVEADSDDGPGFNIEDYPAYSGNIANIQATGYSPAVSRS